MRDVAWLALACALSSSATLAAPPQATATALRPYRVDDLLGLEAVGRAVFSADGRQLVFEAQRPWKDAGRFDLDWFQSQRTSRLYIFDVAGGSSPRRLLGPEVDEGETLGALSPSGRRLIVYRLRDHLRELGVVELASGTVRWSGLCVEPEVWNAQARWRNDHEVVALATTPQTPSFLLGRGWQTKARTLAAWSAAEDGRASVTVVHGGRQAADNPAWPEVQLTAFDVQTAKTRVLARGPFVDLSLAPGGRTVALTANAEPVTISTGSKIENNAFDRRRRLVLVDLDTRRQSRPCPGCDIASYLMSWSPDGEQLVICARPDDEAGDWSRFGYWRISVLGQAQRLAEDLTPGTILENGGTTDRLTPDAGWIGDRPAILARRGHAGPLAWWRIDPDGPKPLVTGLTGSGGRRLAALTGGFIIRGPDGLVALDGRGVSPLTDAREQVLPAPALPGDLPTLLRLGPSTRGRVVNAARVSRPAAAAPEGADLLALSSPSGASLSFARSPQGVGRLVLSQIGKPLRTLMTLNAGLGQVEVAPPRPITYQTPRGESVTSWLYLPARHGPKDDRPLIVVPYPGANYVTAPGANGPDVLNFWTNVRVMVGANYAVLTPSLPIPAKAEPAEGLAEAMLAAVDAALVAEPGLSRTRLAVWGHSYGGYGALVAATQSPRFKAVIAGAGISDLFSMYGAQGAQSLVVPEVFLHTSSMFGWSETGQARMLAPPWAQPDRYAAASPLLAADKITAPVMLIQGDLDIATSQSMEMFSALYRQGKPVDLVTYQGEGHVILSPANVRDVYGRAFAFLQAALSADAPAGPGAVAASPDAPAPSQ